MADDDKYRTKDYVYMALGGAAVLIILAFLIGFCGGETKAAEPPDPALLAQAKANAAAREAEAAAKKARRGEDDTMTGFNVPLTAGYLAGGPVLGSGVGYSWRNGINVMGQVVVANIDGENFVLPNEKHFDRSETGFVFTLVLPIGK